MEPSVSCGDDVIGMCFPDEWLWVGGIVFTDEAIDGGLEIDEGMEDTVLEPVRRVSLAKKPSTALSHEHEVGVKWKVQRG